MLTAVLGLLTAVLCLLTAVVCLLTAALYLFRQCVEVLLEKFKEKKPAIVAALREAVDAIFLTVSLCRQSSHTDSQSRQLWPGRNNVPIKVVNKNVVFTEGIN